MPVEPQVLQELGLDHEVRLALIRDRPDHLVCRVHDRKGSYVLKAWKQRSLSLSKGEARSAPVLRQAQDAVVGPALEITNYRLLAELGVPTIRVIASTDTALLLEDLGGAGDRRMAHEDDLADPAVIISLARWYRNLHDAGPGDADLPWEHQHLTPDALHRTGRRLGLDHEPAWLLATDVLDGLLAASRRLPRTLVHNDFHVTNLAVVQGAAIMIDFELLRVGTRAGDVRNVTGQLDPAAAEIFRSGYGPIPVEERVIDAPLAVLGALAALSDEAVRLPRWARLLVAEVRDGALTRKLAAVADLRRTARLDRALAAEVTRYAEALDRHGL